MHKHNTVKLDLNAAVAHNTEQYLDFSTFISIIYDKPLLTYCKHRIALQCSDNDDSIHITMS